MYSKLNLQKKVYEKKMMYIRLFYEICGPFAFFSFTKAQLCKSTLMRYVEKNMNRKRNFHLVPQKSLSVRTKLNGGWKIVAINMWT